MTLYGDEEWILVNPIRKNNKFIDTDGLYGDEVLFCHGWKGNQNVRRALHIDKDIKEEIE